jgi:isopentenyl-diphosphate delta-isomerase
MLKSQSVILVNELDEAIGEMEKMEAHQKALLHRAFSIFLVNNRNEMLLQQRAINKYHCGGLWSNTCCSHPMPGESVLDAAKRRLSEELGINCDLEIVFNFIYRIEFENGLTEHEFDHVLLGYYNGPIQSNPNEVMDFKWMPIEAIFSEIFNNASHYTPWFLIAFPKLMAKTFRDKKTETPSDRNFG